MTAKDDNDFDAWAIRRNSDRKYFKFPAIGVPGASAISETPKEAAMFSSGVEATNICKDVANALPGKWKVVPIKTSAHHFYKEKASYLRVDLASMDDALRSEMREMASAAKLMNANVEPLSCDEEFFVMCFGIGIEELGPEKVHQFANTGLDGGSSVIERLNGQILRASIVALKRNYAHGLVRRASKFRECLDELGTNDYESRVFASNQSGYFPFSTYLARCLAADEDISAMTAYAASRQLPASDTPVEVVFMMSLLLGIEYLKESSIEQYCTLMAIAESRTNQEISAFSRRAMHCGFEILRERSSNLSQWIDQASNQSDIIKKILRDRQQPRS